MNLFIDAGHWKYTKSKSKVVHNLNANELSAKIFPSFHFLTSIMSLQHFYLVESVSFSASEQATCLDYFSPEISEC